MKKLIPFVLVGMIVLIGCAGESMHEGNEVSNVVTAETDTSLNDKPSTSEENVENFEVNNRDDLLEYDEISGIVIDIGNDRFEILLGTSETVEVDGVEVDMAGFDPYTETIVIVDENTRFELVESDGMSELERWEGSFSDLSIDESVTIFMQELDGEILARKIVIWVWI